MCWPVSRIERVSPRTFSRKDAHMHVRGSLVFAVVALALSAAGQQSTVPPLSQRVDVSVVNVDVTVVDRSGNPTSDLTAADFEVLEDGKPQKITNFYVVDHSTVRQFVGASLAPAVPAETSRFRRKALLVIDNHFIDKRRRNAALAEVQKFIDASFGGNYDWAVASLGSRVRIVQPFTSDRKTIDSALEAILKGGIIPRSIEVDRGAMGVNASRTMGSTPTAKIAMQQSAESLAEVDENLRQRSGIEAMRETTQAVIDTCRAYSAVEGKKLIVLVTGGMESDRRTPGRLMTGKGTDDFDILSGQLLQAMVREANAANFNIHVLNAGGVVPTTSSFDVSHGEPQNRFSDVSRTRDNDSIAFALAKDTGGMYLTSNVIGDSIRKIDAVSSTFYSLGYSPAHFEDGKYHRITVHVKKSGLEVFSRAGYVDQSTDQRLETAVRTPLSASAPEGTLPVHVEGGIPLLKGRGGFSVPITVSMPMNRLTIVPNGDSSTGRVHLYLSVFDAKDKNIGYHHAVQDVRLTREQVRQIATAAANFRYTMNVDVAPGGVYNVVVAVRDEVSDETGKGTTTFDTRG